jgi:hypothetical protein
MNKKIRWITETAIMLALLVSLQAITKPLGQLVTGSCVNAVLAITVLVAGLYSGITVAIISPVLAYLLGIAPNLATVPAIMVGNGLFVAAWKLLDGKALWRRCVAWLASAAVKFGALYALVVWVICGVAADALLAQGILKAPMLKMLPASFGISQLITALIGGAVALLVVPPIKKALHRT